MQIGVPTEIKNHEHRVAITPAGVTALTAAGHRIVVQSGAGCDSGFDDAAYLAAGAEVSESAARVWQSEMVVKVKEPLASEYDYLRPGLVLFTYLHLAAVPELAHELIERRVCAIAYETVQPDGDGLPLLAPMSQVAGRVAAQMGVYLLQRENGTPYRGRGILPGGVAGVAPVTAVILGAGNVGRHAADALRGLSAEVVLLEADAARAEALGARHYSRESLLELLPACDLLIGAALIPGEHAPELLSAADIARMPAGSVFVDVSIDQGGISETSRATTYDEPVYVESGVLHCCLPNMPAVVPQSSTLALTTATLPYVQRLADLGVDGAIAADPALARGINVRDGAVLHAGVRRALAGSLLSDL